MAIKAHVGFTIPATGNVTPYVSPHFLGLGYNLADEGDGLWVFRRGSKLAALWRFDIRAYSTVLTVRAAYQANGELWVSCNWEVWTFLSVATGADVATLEAEGHQLESVLRTLT
jgi:hypothetical protein